MAKTISRTNWGDVVSGTTGNPAAEASIVEMARSKKLLIEDEGQIFVPVEQYGAWRLDQVLSDNGVAESLRIPFHEAQRLLVEAGVPIFIHRERLFRPERLWRASDVKERVEAYTSRHGLTPSEAALELGLTLASYRQLIPKVMYNAGEKVLKTLLEAYRNKYLPRDKIWSTRTSLVREFVDNFNRENPSAPIVAQGCEVDGCGHAASAQCVNTECRESELPRFVCPAHEEWVDVTDMLRRPPALCPSCASKVRGDKLSGFTLL